MVENIDVQIMLSPIIALLLAVIIVILEVVFASRKSRMAGLWPVIIMTALICICFGYVHYVTWGDSTETVRYDMDYGNYATMTLQRDQDGNIVQFSEIKVYNSRDIQMDQMYVFSDDLDADVGNAELIEYFRDRYKLKGSSSDMDMLENAIRFGNMTFSRSAGVWMVLSYMIPLLLIYATVRLIKRYRFRRDEMKKLKIEMEM